MLENPYKILFSRDNWSSDVNGNSDGKLYWYGMGGRSSMILFISIRPSTCAGTCTSD